jgi:hypothetical protein
LYLRLAILVNKVRCGVVVQFESSGSRQFGEFPIWAFFISNLAKYLLSIVLDCAVTQGERQARLGVISG